jgi:hypothetical protein
MAVYGDMLGFFPELMRKYYTFNMAPQKTGGFGARTDVTPVKAIVQYIRQGKLVQEGDTIAATDRPYLWTREKLTVIHFITDTNDPATETVFRINEDAHWKKTGGFYEYELLTMVGDTDTQTDGGDGVDYARTVFG